jgi:alkylhydroperoxidase family enzyme
MLRWLINKRLNGAERKLGVPQEYARHILRVSLRAFFKFLKILPLAEYRRALPAEPFYTARIVATRHDDCGECVQITVNQARRAGISPALLQAVLDSRMDQLPEEVAEACRFAEAVVTASGEEDALRECIRQRYGEEALVELALTIAAGRFFPTLKRALGHAKSCARVSIQV